MNRFLAVLCLSGLAAGLRAADVPSAPVVTINLVNRQAAGTPSRIGFTHTGGGNIDVQQPSADTIVVTMTGVAVAGGHPCKDSVAALAFDLAQAFDISIAKSDAKRAKLTLEARVIGLLRSHECGGGSAGITCPAHAAVVCGGDSVLDVSLPGRSVCCGQNLSVNDRQGPVAVVVPAGKFTLVEQFGVQAAHPRKALPCKAASAEFAPDPALDPLWISAFEPFHGAQKKDFGFQVIVKVTPE